MKKFIHLCFTSHEEVMFRDAADVGMMLNFIALCSWKYDIDILSDAEMSTHVHLILIARDSVPDAANASDFGNLALFVNSLRKRYTCYFNRKYNRPANARLGERGYFRTDVYGNCHMQTAMSYVLRNPWHHGVSGTPFEYPFSSVNDIFPKELGKLDRPMIANPKVTAARKRSNGRWIMESVRRKNIVGNDIWCPQNSKTVTSRSEIARFLPRYSEWPDGWVMSDDHVFLRPCFEDLKQVERLYVTPSAFEYAMFRKTDERMSDEQALDNNGKPPVKLSDIEPDANEDMLNVFLMNEKSGTFKLHQSDFDVCRTVDTQIVPEFGKKTVYELNSKQLQSVGNILIQELHVPQAQVERCLPFRFIR